MLAAYRNPGYSETVVAPLPKAVYVLQSGLVLNAFGNGAANPFVLLYLHDVRGIPLAAAGLASAANAGCALVASLVGGKVADQLGPKSCVLGGLALAAGAFLLYLVVRDAWEAILVGALLGTAAGGWLTGQSALLAAIVPPEKRHIAFAQQRVAANLGLGLGGLTGGLIASTTSPATFTTLFVLNAATFAAYGVFIARVRVPAAAPMQRLHGYRDVLRDRTLLRVLALDVAVVAGAVSLVNGLMPVYARDTVGVGEGAIGVLFLVNSLLIIGGQLPVARAVEGHRRARALALMAVLFGSCWLLVLGGSWWFLVAGIVALSAGECLYDSVRSPLIADLAPPGLGGRYLASAGFSWQLGFIIGPAAGAALLGLSPRGLWIAAAAVCLAAAVGALRLDARLSPDVAVTPARAAG
jgi:MFS family permease